MWSQFRSGSLAIWLTEQRGGIPLTFSNYSASQELNVTMTVLQWCGYRLSSTLLMPFIRSLAAPACSSAQGHGSPSQLS